MGDMIRTSFDAVQRMHHKRTNELLPSKVIDNNTKLVYVDDELVFLRLHETNIATFTPNGVRLHTDGWFTSTTWRRIHDWTPAKNFVKHGLRYVATGEGWDTIYMSGLEFVDGVAVNPIPPVLVRAIERAPRQFSRNLDTWAERQVRAWDHFDHRPHECTGCLMLAEELGSNYTRPTGEIGSYGVRHLTSHVMDRTPMGYGWANHFLDACAKSYGETVHGDKLLDRLTYDLTNAMKPMRDHAVKAIAPPGFEYPQSTHTRS